MSRSSRLQKTIPERGATLATTLAVIGLAFLLGLTLTTASLTHLRMSRSATSLVLAENAAEAVLAEACERVVDNPYFGISTDPPASLEFRTSESLGYITFQESEASLLEVSPSVSNRFGLEPITGSIGQIVPPHSVQLLAVGQAGQKQVVLEAFVQAPEFPYVIASSGPVQSSGTLLVGRADSMEEFEADDLSSTAIASFGKMQISGRARITGILESSRDIILSEEVDLQGESKPNSAPPDLTRLDIPGLRPTATIPLTDFVAPALLSHYHHNGPNIHITQGLKLDDSILYINGDAHIAGGIHGKGAVIVNGDLTIEGSSSLLSETQLALVSQGDLTITGDGQSSSYFQGLIYTEGDFYARDITLVGAFLANRNSNGTKLGSQMEFLNVGLISKPEYAQFDLETAAFTLWQDPSVNREMNFSKESQGGDEIVYLIDVDESDLPDLQAAITVTYEEGGPGSSGGTGENGRYVVRLDRSVIMRVLRARKATASDGLIVSDWQELSPSEIVRLIIRAQGGLARSVNPPNSNLALLDYQAEPDSAFWEISRASLHIDFNEFLGRNQRLRMTSWRKL